ncbi:hypothetical protein F5Y13DRAFT_189277 [Hypoxylon sp. FL1857]|nr:hypothetical protein F5Y13DRAFT_189277 [Hypoxylon sp. FL1857]
MLAQVRSRVASTTAAQVQETMDAMLRTINRVLDLNNRRQQLEALFDICHIAKFPTSRDVLRRELPHMLAKCRFFKDLPQSERSRFIMNVIDWRQSLGKGDAKFVACMVPGLYNFINTTRGNEFDEVRDGNWYLWWTGSNRQQGMLDLGFKTLVEDRYLLKRILEYESRTQDPDIPLQFPNDPRILPSVSGILRTQRNNNYHNYYHRHN